MLTYDDRPHAIEVPAGRFLTLAEAARKTGRPLRVLQRWVKAGILPARYKQATWPYATLVTDADLAAVKDRRAWGRRRTKAKQHRTEGGQLVMLRTQERTDSWED